MTINNAQTLTTTPSAQVTPLEVVNGIYDAFGRGDMPALFALLHPEVDWSVTVTAPGGDLVPMLRHGIGHSAVEYYFSGVSQLEFHVFDVRHCYVDGDIVLAEIHFEASHCATGKRAAIDEVHHWIVRGGLVVRYRPYVDTAALIELFRP